MSGKVIRPRSVCALDLYGQSMLRYAELRLSHLDNLAKILFETEIRIAEEGLFNAPKPKHGYEGYVDMIIDVCEKLGFIWMSGQEIKNITSESILIDNVPHKQAKSSEVKYHFYSLIYNCKANSDSCSHIFNFIHELGFKQEDRDILRNEEFRKALSKKSVDFDAYWKKYGGWFGNLNKRRDQLIHRESMPILTRHFHTKTVYDILPMKTYPLGGGRFDFMGVVGTIGKHKFDFRPQRGGLGVALPSPFDYVFPKERINFQQIAIGRLRRRFSDFESVADYCGTAFRRFKELSEISFKEALNHISRTN